MSNSSLVLVIRLILGLISRQRWNQIEFEHITRTIWSKIFLAPDHTSNLIGFTRLTINSELSEQQLQRLTLVVIQPLLGPNRISLFTTDITEIGDDQQDWGIVAQDLSRMWLIYHSDWPSSPMSMEFKSGLRIVNERNSIGETYRQNHS